MANDPAPDVNPAPSPEAKSFLASKTVWIAILGLVLVPLLKKLGLEFDDADRQRIAEAIVQILTVAGVVWARGKAQGPLDFGGGAAPVLIFFAALTLLLGGCAGGPAVKVCARGGAGGVEGTACYETKTHTAVFTVEATK